MENRNNLLRALMCTDFEDMVRMINMSYEEFTTLKYLGPGCNMTPLKKIRLKYCLLLKTVLP